MLAQRKSPRYAVLMVMVFITAYIMNNFIFGPRVSGFLGNTVLPLAMWVLVILFVFSLPRSRTMGKLRGRRLMLWLALVCVFIGLLGEMLQGAMSGLGRSPFDHSPAGIIINTVSVAAAVAGLEVMRSWAMNRFFSGRWLWGVGILAVLSTLFQMPFNKLTNLSWGLAATKFIGAELLPALAQNTLAGCLVMLGGPVPAIIYRGGLLLMERWSPILPNAGWVGQTLLGVLAPVMGIILVWQIYSEETRLSKRNESDGNIYGWAATSVAAVVIIWFAMGVFSYAPRVIPSGSMQPGINIGDIVIVHKVPGDQVQVDDVILFTLGGMKVSHRVMAVKEVDNKRFFITKGDANDAPERDPVYEKQVQGKVVMVVPKLGWVTLMLRGAVS